LTEKIKNQLEIEIIKLNFWKNKNI
jgi:hypothetical protein